MSACRPWKDSLLERALEAPATQGLDEHLESCPGCATALAELSTQREKLDSGLQQLVQADPAPDLRARVLAAAESNPGRGVLPAWVGAMAAVAVVLLAAFSLGTTGPRAPAANAVSLSAWRSPTESLLHSSAEQYLRTPQLGEFYFPLEPRAANPRGEEGGNDES